MKAKLLLLVAFVMLLGMTTVVLADETGTEAAAPMNMGDMKMDMNMDMGASENAVMNKEEGQAAAPTGAVEVGNKICPVSGEKIVMEKKDTVEYNGKIYNLCCSMCKKDFEKDPEKYIQKLKDMEASGEVAAEEAEPEHQEMK